MTSVLVAHWDNNIQKNTLRLPIKSMMIPGWPGSVVMCISMHMSHPAVTIASAVRNERVNALGDNSCLKDKWASCLIWNELCLPVEAIYERTRPTNLCRESTYRLYDSIKGSPKTLIHLSFHSSSFGNKGREEKKYKIACAPSLFVVWL